MYAFTNDTITPSEIARLSPSTPDPQRLRRALDAVFREGRASLQEIARKHTRTDEDARDAVQDAFVHLLERPPHDTSPRALAHALEGAVRVACERGRRARRDEAAMKIGLRKRSGFTHAR